jgi:hypothetical protein
MQDEIKSKVWQLKGIFNIGTPGMLILKDGFVSFMTEEGEKFKVPLQEIKDVKWPFLQFGLGLHAFINGQKYKFTFMKPNGASELDASALDGLFKLGGLGNGVDSIATLANMGNNKRSAKQWKAILGNSDRS